MPRSVMKPVTRRAGVTSKAGLPAAEPGAAISTVTMCPSARRPGIFRTSSAERSSIGMVEAVFDGPVDGGVRQRHVEGDVVVVGGQRLQVGADLVGDIAGRP